MCIMCSYLTDILDPNNLFKITHTVWLQTYGAKKKLGFLRIIHGLKEIFF